MIRAAQRSRGAERQRAASGAGALSLRGVERRHRNGRGVGPVTLEVAAGACVAVMGPNGAGKTTLLRLLATAERPRAGSIHWRGSADSIRARRAIGFAADTVVEEGALTVRQATHFWCRQWVPSAAVAARVRVALAAFDLLAVADEPVSRCSFGMRRRLGLAQAVAPDPALLLLDEPSAGLDPRGVAALAELLQRRRSRGSTTVVASNDCNFAAAVCDRVVFLDRGCVVRDASPGELLAELDPRRRVDLEIDGDVDLEALRRAGAAAVQRRDGGATVALDSDSALAAVVAAADSPGGRLRSLAVRTPDLGDCFWRLTGRALREAEP